MVDNYRHKGLRKKLVETLKKKGIKDDRILEAIGKVPRHYFLDRAFEDWAYQDAAFPIDNEQTISQPYTVAYQTDLLQIKARDRVLEIGTGSGYQAVILAEMGAKVYSIERHKVLFDKTSKLIRDMGYGQIRLFLKDGMDGLERFAPFDKIIVTAAAKTIPEALKKQLAVGGILVIPVGNGEGQIMYRLTKIEENKFKTEKFDYFRFVPLLKGINE